jgi:hypothetical protein
MSWTCTLLRCGLALLGGIDGLAETAVRECEPGRHFVAPTGDLWMAGLET